MPVIQLPIVKMNGKRYYVDKVLKQLRNVRKPHDTISMDEAFVRVRLSGDYTVLNDPEMIQEARKALFEDIMNAAKYEELGDWITTEPAPDGNLDQVPDYLLEEGEDEE